MKKRREERTGINRAIFEADVKARLEAFTIKMKQHMLGVDLNQLSNATGISRFRLMDLDLDLRENRVSGWNLDDLERVRKALGKELKDFYGDI